jgi:hypothetical protein
MKFKLDSNGEGSMQELIDKILRRAKVILDGLLQVASSPNRDQLKDMEGK